MIAEVEHDQFFRDMKGIRDEADVMCNENDMSKVPSWLQNVRAKAAQWGDRIPDDIKRATAKTEDTYAREGNFIVPIFRSGIPRLVNASCEYIHAQKTSTWRYVYKARNKDLQMGMGTEEKHMVGFKRNRLKYVEITYIQIDGLHFTIRTDTRESGVKWKDWICLVWKHLSEAENNDHYHVILNHLYDRLINGGGQSFPQNLRKAMHEMQQLFGLPLTVFPPVVESRGV